MVKFIITNLSILFLLISLIHPSLSSRSSPLSSPSSSPLSSSPSSFSPLSSSPSSFSPLSSSPSSSSSPLSSSPSSYSPLASSSLKTFSVQSYGAKGDGRSDSTQAFLRAWSDACNSYGATRIYVPKGSYVLRPLIFEGISCKTSSILFQIDGTLVAPGTISTTYSWIVFHLVNSLYIKGGVLDAKGQYLWNCKFSSKQKCPMGAKSLSFDNSKNIVVDGLTSTNSQMFHITINACENVKMTGITITADGDSPNTDGIHMERSKGVTIMSSHIKTGDDCISIGPNCQNVWVEDIHCGPGHGISIGSLGRESDEGVIVRNVTVKSVNFVGTDNGLRIKTFAKPIRGIVQDVQFIGAYMYSVRNPIIIDQNYCPSLNCPPGQGSGIQIKNVVYKSIQGTSTSPVAMNFDCSPKYPCKGLTLNNIQVTYKSQVSKAVCKNAYGYVVGSIQPSSCLGR